LIVEHQEELLGDLPSNQNDGQNSNGANTSFDWESEAADGLLGHSVGALADAAAALSVDGLSGDFFVLICIVGSFHWI
jgi:hypothetical protein